MASFNLIDRAWIPCIRLSGECDELSLREILAQAENIHEIQGDSPLETASVLRLLLVVLHRVYPMAGLTDWRNLWRNGHFDPAALDGYFAKWRHRFDLFDAQHPFFQVADESQLGARGPLNKIVHHVASEHAATLFDHTMAEKRAPILLSPAQAARAVLATQYFGLGYQKFVAAPCTSGIIFVVTGTNLFETLLLNFYPKRMVESAIPDSEEDAPIWESISPYSDRTTPNGLCDFWTWPNRRIKLFLDQSETAVETVAWAPGLRLKDDITDPMQRWRADEGSSWRGVRFQSDRALWRDSSVLLEIASESHQSRPIGAVAWLSLLARSDPQFRSKAYRLLALGMCSAKAELTFLREETTPLSAELMQMESLVGTLGSALERAEKVGYRLSMTTFNLARLLLNPRIQDQEMTDEKTKEKLSKTHAKSSDDEAKRVGKLARSWGVEADYWSQLAMHFHALVNDLPREPERVLQVWHQQVHRAARSAFQRAQDAVRDDPRAARALAVATDQFESALFRLLEPAQPAGQTNEGSNP